MLKKFIREEKAQGSIEYIILAGGVIIAAVIISTTYREIVINSAAKIEAATLEATNAMGEAIRNAITNMTVV